MQPNRRRQMALFVRVVANVFVGALLTALAGLLCGLMMGTLAWWILGKAGIAVGISNPFPPGRETILPMGGGGLWLGLILGALIFVIAAVRAHPGRTFEPLRALAGRVMLGQIAGTLGVFSLILAVAGVQSTLSGRLFYMAASDNFMWLYYGTPVLMICGAIAGALSKRA